MDYENDNCEDCKVAHGFYTAYKAYEKQVIFAVKLLHDKYNADVFVIGDSLGGVIATFGALDIKDKIPEVNIIYYSME